MVEPYLVSEELGGNDSSPSSVSLTSLRAKIGSGTSVSGSYLIKSPE